MDYLPAWLRSGTQENGGAQKMKSPPPPDIDISEPTEDGDSTPKAIPQNLESHAVPAISLDNSGEKSDSRQSDSLPAKAATTTANTGSGSATASAKAMPPPPLPPVTSSINDKNSSNISSSSSLMPPPSRPTPRQQTSLQPQSTPSSLRVPTTGPLPNRGPPPNSAQRVSSPTSTNLSTNSQKKSRKILLSPGHSPMDWAALITNPSSASKLPGPEVPPGRLLRVAPSQLRTQTGRKGKPAWMAWRGKVYNVTPYLPFHPGGEPELLRAAGRDGEKLFMEVHPWVNFEGMLRACLVGVLVEEGAGEGQGRGDGGDDGEDEGEGLEGID